MELPASTWRRGDARDALAARDVSALLRLAQRHSGASQARLATATGFGQGRVNEIINGKRAVTRLDVYERIADGLAMPDDARALLGLAPKRATESGILTGDAEIARVYGSQAEIARELRELAGTAATVDVLAVRVLGLLALNDSLLRGPLTGREAPVRVRVLLLDPQVKDGVLDRRADLVDLEVIADDLLGQRRSASSSAAEACAIAVRTSPVISTSRPHSASSSW